MLKYVTLDYTELNKKEHITVVDREVILYILHMDNDRIFYINHGNLVKGPREVSLCIIWEKNLVKAKHEKKKKLNMRKISSRCIHTIFVLPKTITTRYMWLSTHKLIA